MPRALQVFEPADGGVAEHVRLLSLGLRDAGWDVACAGPLRSAAIDALEAEGLAVQRFAFGPGLGRPLADLRLTGPLAALVRSVRPDVVHTHSTKAGIAGRVAARRAGVPSVHSPHAWSFTGSHGMARRLLATGVERGLARVGARVICVSEHERGEARRAGVPDARVRVVHNGCPPCAPCEPAPELAALRAQGPVVSCVSVLRAQKRVDVFLDAVPLILAAAPHARVALVGSGPLEGELRAQADALGLGREPRFAFVGFQGPSARYLAATDVFALSSDWESLPLAVLEALACGVPQVATDVGGTGEAVTAETGVLVAPGSPQALADAAVSLLDDPARREAMAAASRARHRERFGVERMVSETAAVYEELLA